MHQETLMPEQITTSPNSTWAVFLIRSLLALSLGAFVTFSADHTSGYGSLIFGSWALAQGILLVAEGVRSRSTPGARLLVVQGLLGALIGVAALATSSSGLGTLLVEVTAFAATTAALEIYRSLRLERGIAVGRESLFVGIVTAILAIVFLLIPADGVLVVGLVGAYGIVIGIYLAIAAVSLRLPITRSGSSDRPGQG